MIPWSMLLSSDHSRYVALKSKACCAKLDKYRKTSIFIKTFWISFWWKISQIGSFFHLIIAFGSKSFLQGCDVQKMDDHFQHPLWLIFIILSKLETTYIYERMRIDVSFQQKINWAVLIKNEGIQAIFIPHVLPQPPCFWSETMAEQSSSFSVYI